MVTHLTNTLNNKLKLIVLVDLEVLAAAVCMRGQWIAGTTRKTDTIAQFRFIFYYA